MGSKSKQNVCMQRQNNIFLTWFSFDNEKKIIAKNQAQP